jgi:hypothetical protein
VPPLAESEGKFEESWKPTLPENPAYRCRRCGSPDVWYRIWDSACGGYRDVKYECRGCGQVWWCEGADA